MLHEATKRLVFYDTETSGLSAEYDQIFQFAAVVTDEDLNELDNINVRCQRHPQIVPAFGALRTTGIDPFTLDQANMTNYDLAAMLTERFAGWSPATFIGYNTIRFDEPFLRHLFYRNLFPIYQTQTSGNGRLDIMRLVDAVLAFHPEALKYEKNKKGAPNRKLESLAQLNGFASHDAHDALGDVRATIFIAQLIKDRCPQLWSEYMTSRSKHLFEDALYQTGQFELVDSYSRQRVGATLCSGEDGQVFLCFDIVFAASCANDDPQNWLQDFANKKPSPFFRVKTNSASFVRPISRNELKQAKHSLPIDHALALFDQLSSNPRYISKLKLAERSSRPNYPQKEGVENLIYSGFSSASDQRLMAEFHRLPVQDRARFLGQLEDQRFRSLGMRLIAENWPETLPSNKLAEHRSWVNARLNTPGSGNTIKDELLRAKEALAVCSIQEQSIIQNIIQYYVSLSASAGGSICPRSD